MVSQKTTDVTLELIQPILVNLALELDDIEFKKEGSHWYLRIFIDKSGGVDLEDCAAVTEALSEKLDEVDPIKQPYFLEVSSPGAEKPLKNEHDIKLAIGQYIHVTTYAPIDGLKTFEGILISFEEQQLNVQVKVKQRTKTVSLPYAKVAKARLAVAF